MFTLLRTHRTLVIVVTTLGVCFLILVGAWFAFDGLRVRVYRVLESANLIPPSLPLYITYNSPPNRPSARLGLVNTLHNVLAREDYVMAAQLNAILSQEAFLRARSALKAWETLRQPDSGLLPMADSSWYREWNPDAVAGNLFSHLFVASRYLDFANLALWEQTMKSEREYCGVIPCYLDLDTMAVKEQDTASLLQGATEYVRDGLLSITERFGRGIWFDRLVEITDATLDEALVETTYGPILADSTEVNGAQMQVLVRLYWATGDERYLEMSERIAEAYLFDVLPQYGGMPTDYWDFTNNHPKPEDIRFRPQFESLPGVYIFRLADHGSEIIGGLGELYFLERMLDRPQAERYQQSIEEFFDKLLLSGRTHEGLWARSFIPATGELFNAQLNDTWGYNLAALHTFDLANNSDRYDAAIVDMMRLVTTQLSADWEWGPQLDGYADSIESMLYLLPWFDLPEAHHWVDREIEVMFDKQRDDGFIEGWFLDGNFVRTSLLYGQYKTMGVMLDPWSDVVRVGAAYDNVSEALYIYIAAEENWQGLLYFDTPRHKLIWNLPLEYPRVNGLPEWYVVDEEMVYLITDLETHEVTEYSGQELATGLPIVFQSPGEHLLLRIITQTK